MSIPSTGIPKEKLDKLRAALQQHPERMSLQVAREFGVPELEVVRAMPAERVAELDAARWKEILHSLEDAGPVRVLVSNAAATMALRAE